MRTAVEPSDGGKCTKSLDTLCGGFKTPLPQLTGNRGASASPRHVRKYSAQRLQASSQDSLTQNLDLKAEINARQAWGGEKKALIRENKWGKNKIKI